MRKTIVVCMVLLAGIARAQLSRDQIYELTDKAVEEAVLVNMIVTNCVDFELDGRTVVELSSRVSAEVLRTIVDCVNQRAARQQESANTEEVPDLQGVSGLQSLLTGAAEPAVAVNDGGEGFVLPQYITVQLQSNKSSFQASEIEFRLIPLQGSEEFQTVQYRFFSGGDKDKEIRLFKKSGPDTLKPGNYTAYFYLVTSRKSGMLGRKDLRTDLHRYYVEYDGPGPITLEYFSKEDKTFNRKKGTSIEVHGPVSLYGEEHISVEEQRSFEDLVNMFKS